MSLPRVMALPTIAAFFVACGGAVEIPPSADREQEHLDGSDRMSDSSSNVGDGGTIDPAAEAGSTPSSELETMAECTNTTAGLALVLKGKPPIGLSFGGLTSISDSILNITRLETNSGKPWTLVLSSEKLGKPLAVGSYDAVKQTTQAPGQAGLLLTGPTVDCDDVRGRFRISQLLLSGDELSSLVVDFEFVCDTGPNREAVRGCYRQVDNAH